MFDLSVIEVFWFCWRDKKKQNSYTVIVKRPLSDATVVLSLMEITVTLICMYMPALFTSRGQLHLSVHAE